MATITFKGHVNNTDAPTLVFAKLADTPGTSADNFKVTVNWGDSTITYDSASPTNGITITDTAVYITKTVATSKTLAPYASAGGKEISVTGGWGEEAVNASTRFLSLPKQSTTRYADNLFLNNTKDISLTADSNYDLCFKFSGDYVGLKSCDKIKLIQGETYTLDIGSTQFVIASDQTATFSGTTLTAGTTLGDVEYTYYSDTTKKTGVFEVVSAIDTTEAPSDLSNLTTHKLVIDESAYDDFTYNDGSNDHTLSVNNKNFGAVICGKDANFTFHGIGDFAKYNQMRSLHNDSGHTQTIDAISTDHMFAGCTKLKYSRLITNLDISAVKSLKGLLSGCETFASRLKVVGTSVTDLTGALEYSNYTNYIGNWDTTNVNSLESLFEGTSHTGGGINNWNVSKVESFKNTFKNNGTFNKSINKWNTSSATNMEGMFYNASSFNKNIQTNNTSSRWQVTKVSNFRNMFNGASSFNDWIDKWEIGADNSVVSISMEGMFANSGFNKGLRYKNNSSSNDFWNTTKVISFKNMFKNNDTFNKPLNNWITNNVTTMEGMFHGATAFNKNCNNWNTAKVESFKNTFNGATNFNGSVNKWNTSSATNMSKMFANKNYDKGLWKNGNKWNVGSVEDMSGMFENNGTFNQSLNTWNPEKVSNFNDMFNGASAFNNHVSGWKVGIGLEDSDSITMDNMFANSSFNKGLWTSGTGDNKKWDTSKVTSMKGMFQNNASFNQSLGSWNPEKVSNFNDMFNGASAFNNHVSGWKVGNGLSDSDSITMDNMFANSDFNQGLWTTDAGKWDTSKVTSMEGMFENNDTFNKPLGSWNVNKVGNFKNMFKAASSFDGAGTGRWRPGSDASVAEIDFEGMFHGATSYNSFVDTWKTKVNGVSPMQKVTSLKNMFNGATALDKDIYWGYDLENSQKLDNVENFLANTTIDNVSLQSFGSSVVGKTGVATIFEGSTAKANGTNVVINDQGELTNSGPSAASGASDGSSEGNSGAAGESSVYVAPVDSESFTIDGNQHEGNEEGTTTWLKRPTISWLYDGVNGFTISIVNSSNTEVDSESTAFYQEYYQLTTDLSAGSYTAKVKAVDSSGNSSASTDFSFEVSNSAPTETPVITKGENALWDSSSNKTADFSPVFVLSGANSQYDDIYALSFDGGTTYPTTYEQNASDIRPTFSTLGEHTIKVKLKRGDNLGSETATITFNIVYDADTIGLYNGGSQQDISGLTAGTYTWTPASGQNNCQTGSGRYMETNSSWGRIAVEFSTAQNISVDGAKLQFNMSSTPIFQFNVHANSSVAIQDAIIPLNSKISIDSIERNDACLNLDDVGIPYTPGGKLTKIVLTISS